MPDFPLVGGISSDSVNQKGDRSSTDNPSPFEMLESYSINAFVNVEILKDVKTGRLMYRSMSEKLDERDAKVLKELRSSLESTLWKEADASIPSDRESHIKEKIALILRERGLELDKKVLEYMQYLITRDYLGYGKIDSLMKDSNLEDISCDGVGSPIFVYHRKYQNLKTNVAFDDEQELNNFIVFLAQKGNRQISVSDPILDASTPEGNRINATFGKEVSSRGGTFSIRLFREVPFTPIDLVLLNTATPELMAYIWLAVEKGRNIIVLGGTGVGKTSTLNAISLFIPPNSKVVSIEDTKEINIPHKNWVAEVTRSGVGEGRFVTGRSAGEIDMFDLLVSALRQRPDYVIVGEIRGKEAYNLFQAMTMGQTTLTTMHAHSIEDMMTRLENQPLNIPRTMITSANLIITQSIVNVKGSLERRITEVSEIVRLDAESNELIFSKVFSWDASRDKITYSGHSVSLKEQLDRSGIDIGGIGEEISRRKEVIRLMAEKRVTNFDEIWSQLRQYLMDPQGSFSRIESSGKGRGDLTV